MGRMGKEKATRVLVPLLRLPNAMFESPKRGSQTPGLHITLKIKIQLPILAYTALLDLLPAHLIDRIHLYPLLRSHWPSWFTWYPSSCSYHRVFVVWSLWSIFFTSSHDYTSFLHSFQLKYLLRGLPQPPSLNSAVKLSFHPVLLSSQHILLPEIISVLVHLFACCLFLLLNSQSR